MDECMEEQRRNEPIKGRGGMVVHTGCGRKNKEKISPGSPHGRKPSLLEPLCLDLNPRHQASFMFRNAVQGINPLLHPGIRLAGDDVAV